MSLADACAVAEQIKLSPDSFYIEPSRLSGFLFNNENAATFFKLWFSAKRWPTTTDDFFLMFVERSAEVSEWLGSCGYEIEPVGIVAVMFGSDEDKARFEAVIWPHRATEGVKIC